MKIKWFSFFIVQFTTWDREFISETINLDFKHFKYILKSYFYHIKKS